MKWCWCTCAYAKIMAVLSPILGIPAAFLQFAGFDVLLPTPPSHLNPFGMSASVFGSHPGSPCLSWGDLTSLPLRGSLQDPVLYITHPSIPIADTTASHPGLTWNKWAGTASWLFSQQGSTGIVEEVFWIWRHSHLRDKLWPGEEQAATPSSGSAGTLSP